MRLNRRRATGSRSRAPVACISAVAGADSCPTGHPVRGIEPSIGRYGQAPSAWPDRAHPQELP